MALILSIKYSIAHALGRVRFDATHRFQRFVNASERGIIENLAEKVVQIVKSL